MLRLQAVATRRPGARDMEGWLRRPLRNEAFIEGLQAIDWTLEERGLAGLSDLEGIPWTMPMEQFFEAWVETVLRTVASRTGGTLRVARRRETVSPISWEPPHFGSQRSLVPDLVLQLDRITVIVDAKYKRHWEELQDAGWHRQEMAVREEHRQDLMQVLAYGDLGAPLSCRRDCVYIARQGPSSALALTISRRILPTKYGLTRIVRSLTKMAYASGLRVRHVEDGSSARARISRPERRDRPGLDRRRHRAWRRALCCDYHRR